MCCVLWCINWSNEIESEEWTCEFKVKPISDLSTFVGENKTLKGSLKYLIRYGSIISDSLTGIKICISF